jgi:hypothetical protein
MGSSEFSIKHEPVSFSRSIKITRVFEGIEKLASIYFIKISRETIQLRVNDMHKNVRDNFIFNLHWFTANRQLTKFPCRVISHYTTLTV